MGRHPIGLALNALNRFAESEWADRLHLRKPVERAAYGLTKTGFRLVSTAARQFRKSKVPLDRPARLSQPGVTTDLFDLNVTEEQEMIRQTVRELADDVLRAQAIKCDQALHTSDELLQQAYGLGLTTFCVPEQLGGAATERSPVTTALLAEELSRGDMGLALAILSPIGVANALTHWGTAEQQSTYLPAFAGEQPPLATIAINEPTALFDPMKLSTRASKRGSDWVLNGTKSLVPLADRSELLLVAAETGSGPAVFIVEGGAEGLKIDDGRGMGVRAAGLREVVLENVVVPAQNRLGDEGFSYRKFVDLGSIAWSALAVGTAQAALEYVIPYVNEREAFGEPISHRQAVAFMVSDIAIELEGMRLLTWRAASRAEQGKEFHREAYLARVLCAERGMEIGSQAVQLLGGHGYTKEHPVERWYRDLRAVGVMHNGLHV